MLSTKLNLIYRMQEIRNLLQKPSHRYVVIGGSVYIFELAVIFVAQAMGAGPVMAVGLSFVLGTIVSFALQKLVTFGDRRLHRQIVIPQFVATCLLVIFNFGFTLLVTKLMTNVWPAVYSRTLALAITTLWNFYLYKTHIFKKSPPLI